MTVFIYGLYDPRTQELRYIGKTINLRARFYGHKNDPRHNHKNAWMRQLKELGMLPQMKVLETIENSNDLDWQERERWWIESSRTAGHPITNLDSGGNSGMKKSPETIAKIKLINLGRKHSPETKAARSLALTGRIVSQETRRKISESHKGLTHTEASRVKIRAARARQIFTPETRAKLSAVGKGRRPSPQCLAASAAKCKGVPLTPEFRAILSAAAKRRCARQREQAVDISG